MDYKYLNNPRFRHAQAYFEAACRASRMHGDIARAALAEHGDHGPQISGCVRDHFPEHVKDQLRWWARRVTDTSEKAHSLRPPRVRRATMALLAREVATEHGSGFYGPQPLRGK